MGTVKEFDPDLEERSSYIDRLEQLFIVHEIAGEKRRAILLSSVGPKTYSVLKDLLAPEKPVQSRLRNWLNACKSILRLRY